jgi:hypothetical protein
VRFTWPNARAPEVFTVDAALFVAVIVAPPAVFVAAPAVFVAVPTARALTPTAFDVAPRVVSQARPMWLDTKATGMASESPAATTGPSANVASARIGAASRIARRSRVEASRRVFAPVPLSRAYLCGGVETVDAVVEA